MTEFRIAIDLGSVLPPGSALTPESFPALAHAVRQIVIAAEERWKQFASGAPMPNGQRIGIRSGTYMRSIQAYFTSPFSGEVYSSLAYADAIENGAPERDLKRMLGSSWKVRVNAKGKRYLIIPFRHDTPGSVVGNNPMPQSVHDWFQMPGRTRSEVVGTYDRTSGALGSSIATKQRMTVPGWRYKWGSRLTRQELQDMGLPDRQVRRLAGMVNFRDQEMGSGARHSSYMTFRVMTEDSKGWIAPARPAMQPARQVADELRPVAEEAFQRALAEDVKRMLTPG